MIDAIAKFAKYPLKYEDALLLHRDVYMGVVRSACETMDFSELFRVVRYSLSNRDDRTISLDQDLATLESHGLHEFVAEIRNIVQNACNQLFHQGCSVADMQKLTPWVLAECFKRVLCGDIQSPEAAFLIKQAFLDRYTEAESGLKNAQSDEERRHWTGLIHSIGTYAPRGTAARSMAKGYLLREEEANDMRQYQAFCQAKESSDPLAIRKALSGARSWWKQDVLQTALDLAESDPVTDASHALAIGVWQESEPETNCHLRAAKLLFRQKQGFERESFVEVHISSYKDSAKEPKLVVLMARLALGLPISERTENVLLYLLKRFSKCYWALEAAHRSNYLDATRVRQGIIRRVKNLLARELMCIKSETNDCAANIRLEQLKEAHREYGAFIQKLCPAQYEQLIQALQAKVD